MNAHTASITNTHTRQQNEQAQALILRTYHRLIMPVLQTG